MERHAERVSRLAALVVIAVLAGCGGGGGDDTPDALHDACRQGRTDLARIGPIETLAAAAPAVRRVLAVERASLSAFREVPRGHRALALRFARAIASARLFLASIESAYAQQTMTPLRTSVPGARRVVAAARELVGRLCAEAD